MPRKLTNDEFIQKAIKVHGDKYNYSLVEYNGDKINVIITCLQHGPFTQLPTHHLRNSGCPACKKVKKLTTETFINRAKIIHGNKYDYYNVKYKNYNYPVSINCFIHGIFKQTPDGHLIKKAGCPKCGFIKTITKRRLTLNNFIDKASKVHNNKYIYDYVKYTNSSSKIIIKCPVKGHKTFTQIANNHLRGHGCPICNESKGEKIIRIFLINNKINFIFQKKFIIDNLKTSAFDFYLPQKNICIEYDGPQHFIPIKYFGGYKKLNSQIKRDKAKTEFCKQQNITLIRIRYDENIEEKLKMYNLECND